jgi:hypothetical protein
MVAVVALAIVGLLQVTGPRRHAMSPPNPTDPVAVRHNPQEPLVDIDTGVAGWHTFAFVTNDEQVCGGSASTTSSDLAVTCWMSAAQAATGTWIALPAFQALPDPAFVGDRVLVIGLLRCSATKVELTFHNRTVVAAVQPMPIHGRAGLSIYATWLPLDGATTYGTGDLTSLTPEDGDNPATCPQI